MRRKSYINQIYISHYNKYNIIFIEEAVSVKKKKEKKKKERKRKVNLESSFIML